MPKYLVTGAYTSDGVKGLLKDGGSKRRAAAEELVKSLGGQLEAMYFCAAGDSDIVLRIFPTTRPLPRPDSDCGFSRPRVRCRDRTRDESRRGPHDRPVYASRDSRRDGWSGTEDRQLPASGPVVVVCQRRGPNRFGFDSSAAQSSASVARIRTRNN